jgi:hypothetical protein
MNARIFEGDRVVERLLEGAAEGIAFLGEGRKAPVPCIPVTRWGIEQNLGKSRLFPLGKDFGFVEGIRKKEFHRRKARLPGGLETLQKRDFPEHHAQIGGEARHLNPVEWSCCSL